MLLQTNVISTLHLSICKCAQYDPSCRWALKHHLFIHSNDRYVCQCNDSKGRVRERERPFQHPFTFAQMKGMYVNAMTQREDRERVERERNREREKERPFQHSFHFRFRSNERYVCQCNDSKGR